MHGHAFGLPFATPPAVDWPANAHMLFVPVASTLNELSTGAGAAPAALNDPIGLWLDQSGNARDISQTTAALRGLWDTSPNGVEFDGSLRRLKRTTGGPAAGAVSIGVVFKLASVPGVGVFRLLTRLANGVGTGISELYLCNSAGYTAIHTRCGFNVGAGLGVGAVTTLNTNKNALLVVYNGSGSTTPGNYDIYLNGTRLTTVASGTNSGLSGGVTSVGCGEDNSGTAFYPAVGTIQHVGVWARALDAQDISSWQSMTNNLTGPLSCTDTLSVCLG